MIESFCESLPNDLPIVEGHQVTEAELKAVSDLSMPYFVGLGPVADDLTPAQIRRETRRRARLISPSVRAEAERRQAATMEGKQVVGFILTTLFITYVLPALIVWVIEQLILWALKKEWPSITATITPKTCLGTN